VTRPMADTDVRCHGACVYSGRSVVFVIVLLQCNIFKISRWRSVFSWKSRWSVRFRCLYRCIKCYCRLPWRTWCCSPSQWAGGVRRHGRCCVCVHATGILAVSCR